MKLLPVGLALFFGASAVLPGGAAASDEPLEGSLDMKIRGPGAAPYGIASVIVGSTDFAYNLAKLQKGIVDAEMSRPLAANERYSGRLRFKLERAGRNRWVLDAFDLAWDGADGTTLDYDPEAWIADRLTDQGTVAWNGGRWLGAGAWRPDLEPRIVLETFPAENAQQCESPATNRWLLRAKARVVDTSNWVDCYQLDVLVAHPMRTRGSSEWVSPMGTVSLVATDGKINLTGEAEISPSKVPLDASKLPADAQQFLQMAKRFERWLGNEGIDLDTTLDVTWERTFRGVLRNGSIVQNTLFSILTGASVREKLRVGDGPVADIFREDVRITDQTVEVLVGEPIELEGVVVLPEKKPEQSRWNVDGEVAQEWRASVAASELDELEEDEREDQTIDFYWWQPGLHEVVYTATVDGEQARAKTRFRVEAPPGRIQVRTPGGDAGIYELNAGWQVVYLAPSATHSDPFTIRFELPELPEKFDGEWQFVQLVESDSFNRKKDLPWVRLFFFPYPNHHKTTRCQEQKVGWALDGEYPYPFHPPGQDRLARDTPGASVSKSDAELRVQHDFVMYAMYRPRRMNAQWVPLRSVRWWWKAGAVWDPQSSHPDWWDNLDPTGPKRSEYPADQKAAQYPTWTSVVEAADPWDPVDCPGAR